MYIPTSLQNLQIVTTYFDIRIKTTLATGVSGGKYLEQNGSAIFFVHWTCAESSAVYTANLHVPITIDALARQRIRASVNCHQRIFLANLLTVINTELYVYMPQSPPTMT